MRIVRYIQLVAVDATIVHGWTRDLELVSERCGFEIFTLSFLLLLARVEYSEIRSRYNDLQPIDFSKITFVLDFFSRKKQYVLLLYFDW